MGNYEQLKQSVSDVIKTNGNQEITGSILQNVLLTIISTVGANATFAGIATPATNPGTPDGPVFYLASDSGTYSNFGNIELQDGLSVLMWNGSWSSQQIFGIDDEPTAGSDNLVKSGGVYAKIKSLEDAGYIFAGIATPATNPGTPDGPVFYLASGSGTYTNFGGIELQDGLSILMWNGSWSSQQIFSVDDEPSAGSNNLVKSGGVYTKIKAIEDAGYVFAGVATPSTNPSTPNQKVFYIASEAGTYTNFSAIELQDGLSILMWNGSWSSQQIFSVDNVPTAGSDNLVKSGGVQEELALGAVYDVSAKNPTGGSNNDGKWESLSTLLSDANLNTLIPTAVRKGGMSIKFIQSTDNKYVQYRLKSTSFNTTTSNWANVEDELVEERNARKLADTALQNAISTQNTEIDEFEDTIRTQIDEYLPIQIEGNVTNAPDEEDLTSVSQGGTDVLKFKNRNNLYGMGMIILRRGKTFAEQLTQTNTIYVIQYDFTLTENVTIPANCILEFDGGSISGEHTLNGNGAIIIAEPRKIFNNPNIPGYGSFNTENGEIFPEWFGVDDIGAAISAACRVSANRTVVKLQPKTYHLSTPAKLISSNVIDLNNAIIMVDEDVPAFVDINYGDASAHYQVANIIIKNGYLTTNKARSENYLIDIANAFYLTISNISVDITSGLTLNKYYGIRIGRKTSDYHGALYVNTIKDCFLYHITIEPQVTDSYMINNKIWASNIDEGAITIHSSSWQIISNQIVGGLKGGIYIPDNTNLSGLKIIGNYFDGSYYNIDTQNGINMGSNSVLAKSVINGNNFWHQKGRGIYGRIVETSITGNIFDDCDFYNEGLPDIELSSARNITISANTFIRSIYVTTSGAHHSREDDIKTPEIIKITESLYDSESYVIGNTCYGKAYYGKASYHENVASNNARVFAMYNNIDIFNNNGYYGSGANRPTNVREGFMYFDYNLGKPIWWFANKWVDATGTPV